MKLLLIKITLNLIAILFVEVVVIGGFIYMIGDEPTDYFIRGLFFIAGLIAAAGTFAAIGQSVSDFVNKEYGA
ncbi:TPA: hypothetical protein ACGA4J_001344 [Acinetobacter baumannii]